MMRSEAVATRIAEKMFESRKGHGGAAKIVERHLGFEEIRQIAKLAYELGYQDGAGKLALVAKGIIESHNKAATEVEPGFACGCKTVCEPLGEALKEIAPSGR